LTMVEGERQGCGNLVGSSAECEGSCRSVITEDVAEPSGEQ
jgi:hypothetical protein